VSNDSGERQTGPFGSRVLDHFEHPRNTGIAQGFNRRYLEKDNPWLIRILITLRVEEGVVRAARFKAQSCVTTTASVSALMEMVEGKLVEEALAITPEQLSASLGTVPPEKTYCCRLAVATLRHALRSPCEPAVLESVENSRQNSQSGASQ
jgi:NifU-like protein involved in Fe-S cluster formation